MADDKSEDMGRLKIDLVHLRGEITDHDGNTFLTGKNGAAEIRNADDQTLCVVPPHTIADVSEAFAKSLAELGQAVARHSAAMEARGGPTFSDVKFGLQVVTVGVPIEVHPGDIPNMCKGSKRER